MTDVIEPGEGPKKPKKPKNTTGMKPLPSAKAVEQFAKDVADANGDPAKLLAAAQKATEAPEAKPIGEYAKVIFQKLLDGQAISDEEKKEIADVVDTAGKAMIESSKTLKDLTFPALGKSIVGRAITLVGYLPTVGLIVGEYANSKGKFSVGVWKPDGTVSNKGGLSLKSGGVTIQKGMTGGSTIELTTFGLQNSDGVMAVKQSFCDAGRGEELINTGS